jgi:Flp pilus assembly pilin Flp
VEQWGFVGKVVEKRELIVLDELISFWKREAGQDLVEYSLLLGFISLSGAAMFISMGGLTTNLWSIMNSRLAASNQGS